MPFLYGDAVFKTDLLKYCPAAVIDYARLYHNL